MTDTTKVTRADIVKLAATELQQVTKGWVDGAETRAAAAAAAFCAEACRHAKTPHVYTIDRMLVAVAQPHGALVVECSYRCAPGEQCPATVPVVFRDAPADFEARMRLVVQVPTAGVLAQLHDDWQVRLHELQQATWRDTKMQTMNREAREALIRENLDATPEGRALLEAMVKLAATRAATVPATPAPVEETKS